MRNEIKVTKDDFESILPRNTKIVVTAIVNGREEYYDSRVEDISSNQISIAMPTKKGLPISVSKDSVIKVSAIVENGRVAFDSFVINVAMKPLPMIALSLPDKIRQEQLRQFFRVATRLKVLLFKSDKAPLTDLHNVQHVDEYEVVIEDLSGGGCRIITEHNLNVGEIVTIDLSESPLEGIDTIECKVVWSDSVIPNKKRFSLRFRYIDEAVRDRIVRFVFRRQMELRKILK